MKEIIMYIILIILLFSFVIASIIIIKRTITQNQIKKMYNDIESILNEIVTFDKENNSFKRIEVTKKDEALAYEYVLTTKKYRYYIKIVPNSSNQEICVNNSVKWQLRKSFNDSSLRFVSGIEELMRLDLPKSTDKKINKKLFIIYPNARSLLKYINECEMEFVHPDTDVYGTNIITYLNLKEHSDFIK